MGKPGPDPGAGSLTAEVLRAVAPVLPDGLVVVDSSGRICEANEVAAALHELPPDGLVGLDACEWARSTLAPGWAEDPDALLGLLAGREAMVGGMRHIRLPSGTERAIRVTQIALPNGRIAEVLTDMSASEGAGELRADLGSTLSHDIRTGVSGIVLGLDAVITMGGSELDPLLATFLQRSRGACDRVLTLVSDAHDAVRLPAGLARLSIEDVGIGEVVEAGLQFVRGDAEDAVISLRVDRPEPDVVVRADRDRLVRLVHNLAKFVVDASPRRSECAVLIEHSPSDGVTLTFRAAAGVSVPSAAEGMFADFLSPAVREQMRPIGRSCAFRYCRAAAMAHGWELRIEAREGGLAFRLRLGGEQ